MKGIYAIKAIFWYVIFALDITYHKDILTWLWFLMAVISTIAYLQEWIEELLKEIKNQNTH